MKTIKERLDNKIWKAVDAMLKGIEEQSKRKNFYINMLSFGSTNENNKKKCYGCAATCAIQYIGNRNLGPKTIETTFSRSKRLGFEFEDCRIFELAINELRVCNKKAIFIYFDKIVADYPEINRMKISYINNDNWETELGSHIQLRDKLKELDI